MKLITSMKAAATSRMHHGYLSIEHLHMCRVQAEQESELRYFMRKWDEDDDDCGYEVIDNELNNR